MNMYMQKSSKLFVHYGSMLIETQTFYLNAIFFVEFCHKQSLNNAYIIKTLFPKTKLPIFGDLFKMINIFIL